jgi:hypothetical protein
MMNLTREVFAYDLQVGDKIINFGMVTEKKIQGRLVLLILENGKTISFPTLQTLAIYN